MDMDKRVLRIGTAVILCALALRLLGGSLLPAVQAVPKQELASWILFLQTGKVIKFQEAPLPTEDSTVPTSTQPQQVISPLSFTAADADQVSVNSNSSGYQPDVEALLLQPLNWELTGNEPTVLILHTHGTEAYRECSGYRSDDTNENVVSVGTHIAQLLERSGIRVIHDCVMHDRPSYNGSYSHARAAIEEYLAKYPTIRLVLDIHRDAAEKANGQQIDYTAQTVLGEAAKLMLVAGTDAGGLHHPDWQENMALAVKLQAVLEKQYPGICRPIDLRSSRFNQDLSTGALLVEVGAAGNTRQEALLAAEVLAQGIISLAHGTK